MMQRITAVWEIVYETCSVTKHSVCNDDVGGHGCAFKYSSEKWESFHNNGIIVTLFKTFVLLIEVEPIYNVLLVSPV